VENPLYFIQAIQKYLNEWKNRNKKAIEIAPFVDNILEVTNWEEQMLSNRPSEAEDVPTDNLSYYFQKEFDQIKTDLPLPPEYIPTQLGGTVSFTTSGSNSAFEYISRVGELGTDAASQFSYKYVNSYIEIQENQNRISEVRGIIETLGHKNLLQRYDDCLKSIASLHVFVADRKSVANDIRNLLNGFKGVLLEKARIKPKENITWEIMASRLSTSENGKELIIKQQVELSKLLSRTAEILKDRESGIVTNIDYIWRQTIDFLFIILNSIK
jgi:hypothetical protein